MPLSSSLAYMAPSSSCAPSVNVPTVSHNVLQSDFTHDVCVVIDDVSKNNVQNNDDVKEHLHVSYSSPL
ncbi:hypothetical protein KI387_009297, partial [Taxus chinensis]